MSNTSHVWRISGLFLIVGIAVFVVQRGLRPEGFGLKGAYRAGSLDELLAHEPVYQGKTVCSECHADIFDLHEKDIHFGVQCEDCHGPGNLHVAFNTGANADIPEASASMPREYTLEGCLFCHRKLAARPRNFPQIDPAEHYEFLHVKDPETRCVECHSPHEPLFLLTRVEDARIHPVIQECNSCHDTQPEGNPREVSGHPVIFQCGDCHPTIVQDFNSHEHQFLRCTACHLFHQENETAGRIFKNGNRQFCLLCHEQRPFKEEGRPPQINSKEHLENAAALLDPDGGNIAGDPRACLTCHFDAIHDTNVIKTWREARTHE